MFSWLNDPEHGSSQNPEDETGRLGALPNEIPILPLRGTVAFPYVIVPLTVGVARSIKLVEEALDGDRLIGLLTSKEPELDEPMPGQLHETGVVARVHRVIRDENNTLQVVVQGLERFKVDVWTQTEPYLKARIRLAPDEVAADSETEIEALRRRIIELARETIQYLPQVPDEVVRFLEHVENPRVLIYTIASNLRIKLEDRLQLLLEDRLPDKMRLLIRLMTYELEVMALGHKIQSETREELDKSQREYYLRQQLKTIQKELGEDDEELAEIEDYRARIEEATLPEEARQEAMRELNRLEKLPPQSAEYGVIKTYLDWLTELPWNVLTEDNLDIANARDVLDADHYDMRDVKDRILEYLAVRKLRLERNIEEETVDEKERAGGSILLFVGPPGVGKTSLGRSIARALGRKFTRMSLGGMRDEAEIRGHRRTYIGAMPGRIIQALKRAGSRNPVFMLDEVDKVGADWRGDPASALLEVLDPQQNFAFRDHYLDVDFDLSQVMFIATANTLETIPAPLRDRMEIIHLDGYTEYEKVEIAKGYLIPRQIKANGLRPEELVYTEDGLRQIIRDFTREAGVRNLEREIGRVARKVATQIAAGEVTEAVEIGPDEVRAYLGKPRYFFEAALRTEKAGVATGLAWTPTGGDVLFIEAACMPGKDRLILTGQLGDVMQESARIALSYVRAHAGELGADQYPLDDTDIHLHVPAGAVPKDGPSAGVTLVTALVSLVTGRPVRSEVGMTGEISLQGQVLPIGGLKQKVLAAHRAGLTTVILPKRNEYDLEDVPEDVRQEMTFIPVETIGEVLQHAIAGFTNQAELALDGDVLRPEVSLN
ncbi:MAG: endopeptidase La [Anaerolineae bacterium]